MYEKIIIECWFKQSMDMGNVNLFLRDPNTPDNMQNTKGLEIRSITILIQIIYDVHMKLGEVLTMTTTAMEKKVMTLMIGKV